MFYILALVLFILFLSAAIKIQVFPYALQLRYLQTLREVSAESNSATLLPIPIDLFEPFLKKNKSE
jgi:hypothetical protein